MMRLVMYLFIFIAFGLTLQHELCSLLHLVRMFHRGLVQFVFGSMHAFMRVYGDSCFRGVRWM